MAKLEWPVVQLGYISRSRRARECPRTVSGNTKWSVCHSLYHGLRAKGNVEGPCQLLAKVPDALVAFFTYALPCP